MEIIKEPAFKTWDLGKLPGTSQTERVQGILDTQLISRPQEPAGDTGESFIEFSTRVLDAIKKLIESAPDNTVVVTHNSVFGLIKLWNLKNRPKYLDRPFRTEYTKQGSDTGDFYTIKSKNGTIYICRHGETKDNVAGNFRQDNTELTDKGKKEALELGGALENVKISQIVTSPLPRTIETSNTILKAQVGDAKELPTENEATEEAKKESKGLCKSVFLYMEPAPTDNKETFASCAGCRMFLKKQQLCSLHGPDLKVDRDDSCGLFVRGKAPIDEIDHLETSVKPEESGFTEGPVQCQNCHYYWPEKDGGDCLLFRMLGIENYKVPPHACCNAFSPKHTIKEDSKEDKDK